MPAFPRMSRHFLLLRSYAVRKYEQMSSQQERIEISANFLAERTDVKVHWGKSFHLLRDRIFDLAGDGKNLRLP